MGKLARKIETDPPPPPTEEQEAILEKVRMASDNLVINALAGTGKTTTLEMVQTVSKQQPILYLAFNKKVAKEAEKRFAPTTTVKTLNGLGHGIWTAATGKPTLEAKKTQEQLRELISSCPRPQQQPIWDSFWQVVDGVAMAKALGYVPDGKFPHAKRLTTKEQLHVHLEEKPDELTSDLIDTLLSKSIQTAYRGYIDYNDQIYMPALFGGTFPKFPMVLADEAQDFSPVNHALLDRVARNRLIAVGDPWQSIYAFRGAKTRSMQELTDRFHAETLTLSLCFRCPKPIVEAARWRTPELRWVKEEGKYEILKDLEISQVSENAAIICRNNAPLYSLALRFLRAGRSVSVAGSEIGPKIVSIMRSLGSEDMSQRALLLAIEEWRANKLQKQSKTANDTADCMKVFAQHGKTLSLALAYARGLFESKGNIILTTGHKAKGLEWDVVYHLDPWLCGGDDQDLNLRYVITTRALRELYEIDTVRIK